VVIQNNLNATNAHNKLNTNVIGSKKSSEKLSSGFRVNRAGDDAAGLAVSEKMRTQIRGLSQAVRNANDGINFIQTAEGALSETHAMIKRLKELAVQSANGTYTNDERALMQLEINALKREIDRIAEATDFNGIRMLNGACEIITGTRMVPVYEVQNAPINDVIMNQIQASVTNPPVGANGRFIFFATNNVGDTSQLLFGGTNPTTSYPAIRVNGIEYSVWGTGSLRLALMLDIPTVHNSGVWTTTYGLRNGEVNLSLIQRVSIVDNPSSIGGQSYRIDYEVVNNNPDTPVTFDLMYNVDTQLGSNDRAPFMIDGVPVSVNTSFPRDAALPGRVGIYDSLSNPFIFGTISINSSSGLPFAPGSEPDRLDLYRWGGNGPFGNLHSGILTNQDSAYSVIWQNRTATHGSSVVMTTYYGVRNPPAERLAEMGASVDSPVLVGYREEFEGVVIQIGDRSGEHTRVGISIGDMTTRGLRINNLDVSTQADAILALGLLGGNGEGEVLGADNSANVGTIDHANFLVSRQRAVLGAIQNRLEHTVNSLTNTVENITAAESQIRDTDMAAEMLKYTKYNILQQTAQAMLAQANQNPQAILQAILQLLR
jgi:flagellin